VHRIGTGVLLRDRMRKCDCILDLCTIENENWHDIDDCMILHQNIMDVLIKETIDLPNSQYQTRT